MDIITKNMINSLTVDIIHSFYIPIPIQDMDELVHLLGGSIHGC